MKKLLGIFLAMLLLTACGQEPRTQQEEANMQYTNITAQQAKEIMDTQTGYVILDVRAQSEYDEGHIPGAIVIPHNQVKENAEDILLNKDQLILVYCRSGRRSKLAAEDLVDLGYTNIKEFGGILDWPYEVER